MTAVLFEPAAGPVGWSAGTLVPVQDPAPPPGKGPEFGNASPVGLVVVLLLLIATILLIRSMSKRIRRLPESFDQPDDGGTADGGGASDEARGSGTVDALDAADEPGRNGAGQNDGRGVDRA